MASPVELLKRPTFKYFISAVAAVTMAAFVILEANWLGLNENHDSKNLKRYFVEGNVLVNGEPAENVNVAFHPLDREAIALCPVGRTDRNGTFRLTTNLDLKGAPAGDYDVTFVWPDASVEIDECECPDPLIHDQFKGLYASADFGYRVTVERSINSYQFSLWRPRDDDGRQ